jgi:hypothetical protein
VIDSTELAATGESGVESVSTDAGSVGPDRGVSASDPTHGEGLAACEAHVRSVLPLSRSTTRSGVAGTLTSAADSRGALVHGDRPGATLDRLAALPRERERVHGQPPQGFAWSSQLRGRVILFDRP